jgi:hypothetical protein
VDDKQSKDKKKNEKSEPANKSGRKSASGSNKSLTESQEFSELPQPAVDKYWPVSRFVTPALIALVFICSFITVFIQNTWGLKL